MMFAAFMVSLPSLAHAQFMPSMECHFYRFIQIRQDEPAAMALETIDQSMKIDDGETDPATLALDGTKRATNSTTWSPIPLRGRETYETMYLGDFREVLALKHDLGANLRPLKGGYAATLTEPGVDETHISIGSCVVK